MNTGTKPVPSVHRLLTTAAWRLNGKTTYALEGSAFIAGAMVQWLRDGIGLIKSAAEIEELARSVESSDGVVAVPALSGLGAPHWQPDARGVIWGLTRGTTRAHIARAALEGIALQNVDILRAMENDLGKPLVELKVDGGASANNLLMQMQSDFLGRKIVRPEMTDTTALGAALLAGLGVGLYTSLDDIRANWKVDQVFESAITEAEREAHLRRWNQAVQRV
jgi:glycerol kinase